MKVINKIKQDVKDITWLKKEIHRLDKINKSRGHCSRTFCRKQDLEVALKNQSIFSKIIQFIIIN